MRVVEAIQAAGQEAQAFAADLTAGDGAAALFRQVEESLGPVACLVNNAGINRDALLAFMTEEQWDEVIASNLRSAYPCSKLAVVGMMRREGGSICNIVSPSGIRGQAGQVNYAASKGGMIAFTKALAREVGRFNIRVNAVCPGVVPYPHIGQIHRKGGAASACRHTAGPFRPSRRDRAIGRVSCFVAGKLHHRTGNRRRWGLALKHFSGAEFRRETRSRLTKPDCNQAK